MLKKKVSSKRRLILVWILISGCVTSGLAGFDLGPSTIESGGGVSQGGGFSLVGTIGQAEAGVSTGGAFHLSGGFWAMRNAAAKTVIFVDDFESGNALKWSSVEDR